MLMSSRRDPPRHISLPKSSGKHLSIRDILLHSPLPSPSLPSILPRHGKKPPKINTPRILRYLSWLAIGATLIVLIQRILEPEATKPIRLAHQFGTGKKYEIVGEHALPDFASPVAVTNKRGKSRWTISIPASLHFPLAGSEYAAVCASVDEMAAHVTGKRVTARRYKQIDPAYIDIMEAQRSGHLPSSTPSRREADGQLAVCQRSLTYVLDSTDAGLGQSLLGLWMSYAIAKKERRAFFIDDTSFTYGAFTNLFSPPAEKPTCRPPPWEQRTPCPRQANHLVVTLATHPWMFGRTFLDHFSTKEIYSMARQGYEALFRLRSDDQAYVESRLSELKPDGKPDHNKLVGLHIRRGDQHPFEFQYQHGYLPPSVYMSAAREAASDSLSSSPSSSSSVLPSTSTILLASDDADLYQDPAVIGTMRAQDLITLASKSQLSQGGLGWERGFFSDAFWSIGTPDLIQKQPPQYSPSPTKAMSAAQLTTGHAAQSERDFRSDPTPDTLQLREYIGRAYLLDLAMLGACDEVVCGVSSRGCRILGVMMGWDKVTSGKWKNVDGHYGWSAWF